MTQILCWRVTPLLLVMSLETLTSRERRGAGVLAIRGKNAVGWTKFGHPLMLKINYAQAVEPSMSVLVAARNKIDWPSEIRNDWLLPCSHDEESSTALSMFIDDLDEI